MQRISLPFPPGRPTKILFLGAHADDIEIGCGGTIQRLLGEIPDLDIRWVVFSAEDGRSAEARASAMELLQKAARSRVEMLDFRNGYFPYDGAAIKDRFETLKGEFEPSLIFSHWTGDAHQDHRLIAEITHQTFRDHVVMEYEIPKYDGDLGNPNFFVQLTEEQLHLKTDSLRRHFPSQQARHWFTDDTFRALARLRGIACRAGSGLAEAFYAKRLLF